MQNDTIRHFVSYIWFIFVFATVLVLSDWRFSLLQHFLLSAAIHFLPAYVCWWIICQYIVIDDLHCQRISPLSMSVLIYGHIRLLKVTFLYGGTLMGFFSICYLWFLWFCIFVSILDEWVVIVNGSLHVDENFLYLTMFSSLTVAPACRLINGKVNWDNQYFCTERILSSHVGFMFTF